MPDGNGFFPPVDYSPLWGILGLAIIGALAVFYMLVILFTRPRRSVQPVVDTGWIPTSQPVSVQERYLDLIGEVEEAHARGELDVRAAQQRLSLLLRRFAFEASGLDAPRMTLAELRASPAVSLTDAVGRLYPGEFGAAEQGSVAEAAALARQVVQTWN